MSTEQAGAVVIQVTAEDFSRLCENSMLWAGGRWDDQSGRFEDLNGGTPSTRQWKRIYWLGPDYTAVIFARAFLNARGFDHEILYDTASDQGRPMYGWVILTDYQEER